MRLKVLFLTVFLVAAKWGFAAEVGDIAPGFELQTIDGRTVHLSDYRGKKAVFLAFWNTWCVYCIKKTDRYKRLQRSFGDRVEVLAVNTTWDDSPKKARRYRKDHAINYALLYDDGEVVTRRYGVKVVPTEFIIGTDGIIRYRDGIPQYIAAHVPDWYAPYTPDMRPVPSCPNPDAS